MATHPNRVITRDELLRRVWDVDPRLTDTRSVEMTVMRLRDKLGAISASPLETLRRQGYRDGSPMFCWCRRKKRGIPNNVSG